MSIFHAPYKITIESVKKFKSYVCSILWPDHFIQMNQVNTVLYLSIRPISAKNYELELISSDYRLNRQVRQSRRNLAWTLTKSLGEKMIVQPNYMRIKHLSQLLNESWRQKTIKYGAIEKLVITNLETLLGNTITKLEIKND